ncbi:DNA damage-regulated autophagy modulator protein 1-like isoform X1 [Glandiceps talaboti]
MALCEPWFCIGMGWLPISVVIMISATFVISYCISVVLGHVPAEFPYISDTGTYQPESCIFGQLLNITAALAFMTIYVRYKQVVEYNREASARVLTVNKVSLVLGGLACLGMSMVGNFQEKSIQSMHLVGAFMCFGFGVAYTFIQSWISFRLTETCVDMWCSIHTCRVRLLLSTTALIGLMFTSVFAALASARWTGSDATQWKPEEGGYAEHIVSTVSEWVLAISFLSFFFTFIREFQKVTMEAHLRLYTEELEPINHPEI